jgi:hypothetical protein
MDWETYKKTYHSYELSVNQTRVLTIVAAQVLENFPKKIPKHVSKPMMSELADFFRVADAAIVDGKKKKAEPVEINAPLGSDLSYHVFAMRVAQQMLGTPFPELDFERLLWSQELVMLFAHLDAFMADSLRIVCRVRPEVLKTDRKIEWAKVVSSGGWEELLSRLAEQHVFEFGWRTLSERIEYLNDRLGLALEGRGYDVKMLEEAENIRHIVVHNGGRASQEFIDRKGRNDLAVGDIVPVTAEYLEGVCLSGRLLASELFTKVSKKFFHVDESDLQGIWRVSESQGGPGQAHSAPGA